MFSHAGCSGSAGGLAALNEMWHAPQHIPTRKGGSIDPSIRWFVRESGPDRLQRSIEAGPRSHRAVQRSPPLGVEARVGKLPEAEDAR